jgi:glycosyltransferase involved in cell wall biosynthesis
MAVTARPLVSIVTPVFNGARYLPECIASVLGQTYTEFEYVIADNASTDDSLAIARTYADRDQRVRVIATQDHLPNHIANWNRALSYVDPTARYVKVLHADDWLFEQCVEQMVELAEQHPSVGIVGAYRLDHDRVTLDGLPLSVDELPGTEVARSFLLGGPYPFLFGSPSSLLLRADVIRAHQPFYDEEVLHADNDACMRVLEDSDFGFVHQVLTYTRRHETAISTTRVNRIGTHAPNQIDLFQRWGHVFLSKDEYQRKQFVLLLYYSAWLATNVRKWSLREFRTYHRERARRILARTSPRELVRGFELQVRKTVMSRARARQSEA